jgi:tetratricopeptide (TPR) repeat protein
MNQVDTAKTRHLLYDVYVMTSMMDPKVEKDDNTRGLLINYAASYLALAGEYQKAGRHADGEQVLSDALKFDLDADRKLPLFYHASVFATLAGNYDKALEYLDSVQARGLSDPELSLRRGIALQGKGDFIKAEEVYRQSLAQDPNRPEAVQALHRLYIEDMRDTNKARAVLQDWLKRNPGDTMALDMLKELS